MSVKKSKKKRKNKKIGFNQKENVCKCFVSQKQIEFWIGMERNLTSVAHPLFAEWAQGLVPPQLVHATISLGPLCSRFFSVYLEGWKCFIDYSKVDSFYLFLKIKPDGR